MALYFRTFTICLSSYRDIRAYDRKVKKAIAKKNKDLATRLLTRKPSYTLDRLIRERFAILPFHLDIPNVLVYFTLLLLYLSVMLCFLV